MGLLGGGEKKKASGSKKTEKEALMNLGEKEAMKKIFGKEKPSDADIKGKFGSMLPDLKTIYAKVDAATLKELTGSEKPTGKQVAKALKPDLMNLSEKEVFKKIFGKSKVSDADIKDKFGTLMPDLKTIHSKVDGATLKELTGTATPTGK